MPLSREAFSQQLLTRHFVGAAFEDSLFNTDNNDREKACAWKIQSNLMLFSALTKESWLWRAVGIPLELVDGSVNGDIDLMFAMRPAPNREDGHMVFPPSIYRCFELKTSKVKKSGEVKSLKEGKIKKTVGQLRKLHDFGAPQVFLLEAFIVEAGFAPTSGGTMPLEVRNSIAKKRAEIEATDFGYATLPIEQIPGFSESGTGILWPVETVKTANTNQAHGGFLKLVSAVEGYAKKVRATNLRSVVTYCYRCRSLCAVDQHGPYECTHCSAPLI